MRAVLSASQPGGTPPLKAARLKRLFPARHATSGAIMPAYKSGCEIFCDPFPSLVIQDEAHLLDESLGTFAGLFG